MCSTYKQLCLGIVFFYLIKIGGGKGLWSWKSRGEGGAQEVLVKKEPSIKGGGGGFFPGITQFVISLQSCIYHFPDPLGFMQFQAHFLYQWKLQGGSAKERS